MGDRAKGKPFGATDEKASGADEEQTPREEDEPRGENGVKVR